MKTINLFFLLTIGVLAPGFSAAQSDSLTVAPKLPQDAVVRKIQFLVGTNLEYGGDEVLEVFFENGNSQKMLAGQGATLFTGVRWPLGRNVFFDTSFGIKYVTTAANNANIRFLRYPLEGMLRVEPGAGVYLAGGVTKHLSNNLKIKSEVLEEGYATYGSNLGVRVEAGWKFVGLSYTNVRYTPKTFAAPLQANTLGLSLRHVFGA